jgi:predicted lipoprotein
MSQSRSRFSPRAALLGGAAFVLLAAMVLDTRVVRNGAQTGVAAGTFSAGTYGSETFPKVRDAVVAKAVDAATLADALAKDSDAAEKQYAVMSVSGPEYPVRFTGVAGAKDDDTGAVPVKIDGLPPALHVSVQTGPAIMGTDLRDGSGLVKFGQFDNQIDYQNAGSALNNAMKQAVLSKLGDASLSGKTVDVVGVFQPTDPNEWVVTPVRIDVK